VDKSVINVWWWDKLRDLICYADEETFMINKMSVVVYGSRPHYFQLQSPGTCHTWRNRILKIKYMLKMHTYIHIHIVQPCTACYLQY
jgi:hypothetical protein